MTDPKKIFENFEANIFDLTRTLTKDECVRIEIHKNEVKIHFHHDLGDEASEQASYEWSRK